jgi:hypothetical protein
MHVQRVWPRVARHASRSMTGLTSITGVPWTRSRASTSMCPCATMRTVQAHRVRPIGRTGTEHAGKRLAHAVLGVRGQLVARRQHGIAVSGHGRIPASMLEKAHDKRR